MVMWPMFTKNKEKLDIPEVPLPEFNMPRVKYYIEWVKPGPGSRVQTGEFTCSFIDDFLGKFVLEGYVVLYLERVRDEMVVWCRQPGKMM